MRLLNLLFFLEHRGLLELFLTRALSQNLEGFADEPEDELVSISGAFRWMNSHEGIVYWHGIQRDFLEWMKEVEQ